MTDIKRSSDAKSIFLNVVRYSTCFSRVLVQLEMISSVHWLGVKLEQYSVVFFSRSGQHSHRKLGEFTGDFTSDQYLCTFHFKHIISDCLLFLQREKFHTFAKLAESTITPTNSRIRGAFIGGSACSYLPFLLSG